MSAATNRSAKKKKKTRPTDWEPTAPTDSSPNGRLGEIRRQMPSSVEQMIFEYFLIFLEVSYQVSHTGLVYEWKMVL